MLGTRPDVLLVLTVPWDPNRLSNNRRLHWRRRHEENQLAKLAAWAGWHEAGEPGGLGAPVGIRLIVRRGRAIDIDNAITGMKPCLDFLFNKRLTPDDSPKWVRFDGVTFEVGGAWRGKEEVIVICERRSDG